jgi:hypothetical protein
MNKNKRKIKELNKDDNIRRLLPEYNDISEKIVNYFNMLKKPVGLIHLIIKEWKT